VISKPHARQTAQNKRVVMDSYVERAVEMRSSQLHQFSSQWQGIIHDLRITATDTFWPCERPYQFKREQATELLQSPVSDLCSYGFIQFRQPRDRHSTIW